MSEQNELVTVHLEGADGSSAEIRTQGATLTSWKTADGQARRVQKERIFVSGTAKYAPGAAIRGGAPICWPQFAMRGPLRQQHGFARNSTWGVVQQDKSSALLVLDETSARLVEGWTAPFQLEMQVTLGGDTLRQTLRVRNTSTDEPLSFTAALHTYFVVPDLASVRVAGLKGLQYEDNARNGAASTELEESVRIEGELDRLYVGAPDTVELHHAGGGICLQRENLPDVVVWNPAAEKAGRMADLSDWRGFVCVEAARAAGEPVVLAPGADWAGSQQLSTL